MLCRSKVQLFRPHPLQKSAGTILMGKFPILEGIALGDGIALGKGILKTILFHWSYLRVIFILLRIGCQNVCWSSWTNNRRNRLQPQAF